MTERYRNKAEREAATDRIEFDLSTERHKMLMVGDSFARFCVFSLVMTFGSAATADPSQNMIDLMEQGIKQYAEISGTVASCDFENGRVEIDDLIDDVAAWRYPSWWERLSGTRDDYAAKLRTSAHLSYDLASLDGCPGSLFIANYRMLKSHWHDQLSKEVNQD